MWLRIGTVIRLGTGLKADTLESAEIADSRECNKVPKADLKNAQKAECTVALPRWPSRKDGTGTEPRASDGKRNDMGK
jgi:hypothetical protein